MNVGIVIVIIVLGRDNHHLARFDPVPDVSSVRVTRLNTAGILAGENLDRLVRRVFIDILVAAGGLVTVLPLSSYSRTETVPLGFCRIILS